MVPPVAVVRRHRHAVLPPPAVRLARQEVFAPLEVGDARAVVKQVHALGEKVVDAQPHGPVPGLVEGLDVVCHRLLLPAVAGHGQAATALQALAGRPRVVLKVSVDQVTLVAHPAPFLASWSVGRRGTKRDLGLTQCLLIRL